MHSPCQGGASVFFKCDGGGGVPYVCYADGRDTAYPLRCDLDDVGECPRVGAGDLLLLHMPIIHRTQAHACGVHVPAPMHAHARCACMTDSMP